MYLARGTFDDDATGRPGDEDKEGRQQEPTP